MAKKIVVKDAYLTIGGIDFTDSRRSVTLIARRPRPNFAPTPGDTAFLSSLGISTTQETP